MRTTNSQWRWKLKRKKKFLIYFFIVIHPFFVFFCKTCIEFDIAFNRPDLTYKGDKTVPEADIIHLDKITLRDLREDHVIESGGKPTHYSKCYIVKKNNLSRKKLKAELIEYCKDYYEKNNTYDQIAFIFYEEGGRMPWFWNDDGYFPDLEYNSDLILGRCFVDKKGCRFREDDAW